jgi:hypothetical protein
MVLWFSICSAGSAEEAFVLSLFLGTMLPTDSYSFLSHLNVDVLPIYSRKFSAKN